MRRTLVGGAVAACAACALLLAVVGGGDDIVTVRNASAVPPTLPAGLPPEQACNEGDVQFTDTSPGEMAEALVVARTATIRGIMASGSVATLDDIDPCVHYSLCWVEVTQFLEGEGSIPRGVGDHVLVTCARTVDPGRTFEGEADTTAWLGASPAPIGTEVEMILYLDRQPVLPEGVYSAIPGQANVDSTELVIQEVFTPPPTEADPHPETVVIQEAEVNVNQMEAVDRPPE